MTFEEMRAKVLEKLNESPVDFSFVSEEDVDEALNDGYDLISDATEWNESTTPIPVRARQTYYDLRGLANSPVLTPFALQFPQGPNNPMTRWLVPVSVRDLDAEGSTTEILSYPRWETVNGLTSWLFMRGLFWLGIVPRSAVDSGVMRLAHTSMPRSLVEDSDEPEFPEEFHPGLIHYALYDIFAQDEEQGLALEQWGEYIGFETGLKIHVQERQTKDRIVQMGPEQPI